MDTSIFVDKKIKPAEEDLIIALGKSYDFWKHIHDEVYIKFPGAVSEWNFSGEKYGWSFRVKDKKRVLVYLLPRDKKFLVAFVFGQKAFEKIINSSISEEIKLSLKAAKVYAEGRGIRIEVINRKMLEDISQLIDIKLAF